MSFPTSPRYSIFSILLVVFTVLVGVSISYAVPPIDGCNELNGSPVTNGLNWAKFDFTGDFQVGDVIAWNLQGMSFAIAQITDTSTGTPLVNTDTPPSNIGTFTIPSSGEYKIYLIAQNNGGAYSATASCVRTVVPTTTTTTTTTTSTGPAVDPSTIPPDDRLNYGHGDSSMGIGYVRADNGITIYGIDANSNGFLAARVAYEDLPSCDPPPTENQLLASSEDGKYQIWLLTTCEYQINMGPDAEGKVQVVTWRGVPAVKESVKSYDFNVFDVMNG